jgi:hypothetical protein
MFFEIKIETNQYFDTQKFDGKLFLFSLHKKVFCIDDKQKFVFKVREEMEGIEACAIFSMPLKDFQRNLN